jgi:hypothetical protein
MADEGFIERRRTQFFLRSRACPCLCPSGYELSDKKYKNPDGDVRGRYSSDPITKGHSYKERRNTYYPIQDPETGWWYPCNPDSVWRFASEKVESVKKKLRSETIEALIKDKRIIFPAKTSVTYKNKKESLQDLGKGSVAHLRETGLPSTDGVRPLKAHLICGDCKALYAYSSSPLLIRVADGIKRDTGAGLKAIAFDFHPPIAAVEALADRRRRLRRAAVAFHLFGPQLDGTL